MTFAQGMFSIDPKSTPDQVAKKRAMIAALMPRYGSAKYVGEGLGQLAHGVMTGIQNRKLDKVEGEGAAGANDIFSRLMGRQGAAQGSGAGPMSVLGIPPDASQPMPAADSGMIGAQGGGSFGLPAADAGGLQGGMSMPPQDRAAAIRSGLVARGMPEHIADGFVTNWRDESGLDAGINEAAPTVEGSRGGFGLAQWTGPRRRALEGYAASQGKPASDTDVQLDYLMTELSGPESAAWAKISGAKNSSEAALAVLNDFERPAEEHRQRRAAKYAGNSGEYAPPQIPMTELYAAMQSPWMNDQQRAMIGQMIDQQTQAADPMQQMQVQKARIELDQMQNPGAPQPIEVGGVLLDPTTYQPIFDSRTQAGGDGFTLGAGQQRYDAAGNMIASGPEAVAPRPLNAQERQQWGIPASDTRPYAVEPGKPPQLIGGGGTTINNELGGGSSKQIFDAMDTRSQIAQSASTALTALNEAEAAVDGGIISGAGANQILGLQKVATAMGADPAAITNTETFRAAMAPVVAATLKATAGTANLSNADMEFAKQAAGGDITLDSTSIKRLLGILRRANEGVVSAYKSRVDTVYPEGGGYDRERSIFGIAMPEAYGAQGGADQSAVAGMPDDLTPEEKAMLGLQ